MSSFTTPLKVEVLDNGKEYRILETFTYYKTNQKHIKIKVEKDFITDFASVPRIFWIFYPPFGTYTKPAVLHDRLCEAFLRKETWNDVLDKEIPTANSHVEYLNLKNEKITRKQADTIFLESMKAINVNVFTRMILYISVRIYAIIRYGKNA